MTRNDLRKDFVIVWNELIKHKEIPRTLVVKTNYYVKFLEDQIIKIYEEVKK